MTKRLTIIRDEARHRRGGVPERAGHGLRREDVEAVQGVVGGGGSVDVRTCETCRYYLGDGCCRIDLEDECAAGNYEAWEEKDNAEQEKD